MSHSVRFLALAITAWAGVRAITLGLDPGRDALAATLDDSLLSEAAQGPTAPAPATPPPAPGMQVSMAYPSGPYGWMPPYPPPWAYQPAAAPPSVIRVVHAQAPAPAFASSPMAIPAYYYAAPPMSVGNVGFLAPNPAPALAAVSTAPLASPPIDAPKLADSRRLRGHVWGHYRQDTSGLPSLAPGGMLGGSQAGVRLLYRFAPGLDLSARNVAAFGTFAGSEAALGVRYAPFADVPLALTAERRQRISGTGRSDFAAFAEYGAYGVGLPAGFTADGFAQAGIVGLDAKDWFLDAQLSATRPMFRDIRLGAGIWTAAQRGLNRVDIGPRLTVPVGDDLALHADYRVNIAGNAAPGDGATVTFAKDF